MDESSTLLDQVLQQAEQDLQQKQALHSQLAANARDSFLTREAEFQTEHVARWVWLLKELKATGANPRSELEIIQEGERYVQRQQIGLQP